MPHLLSQWSHQQVRFNELFECTCLWWNPFEAVDLATFAKEDERRQALDAKLCRQLGRLVRVQLGHTRPRP